VALSKPELTKALRAPGRPRSKNLFTALLNESKQKRNNNKWQTVVIVRAVNELLSFFFIYPGFDFPTDQGPFSPQGFEV
jgi:hypothetical protein